MQDVQEMFGQLKALLGRQARRLLQPRIEEDELDPRPLFDRFKARLDDPAQADEFQPPTVPGLIDEEIEGAVVRTALCLDLAPNYPEIARDLAARGGRAAAMMAEFLEDVAQDPELQIVAVNVQQALDARQGEEPDEAAGELHPDHEILGDLVRQVDRIAAMLPERMHASTSGSRTLLRRVSREFEDLRRRHATDPGQLGTLAMVLVRLDRADNYEELLDQIRWMGPYAVGERKETERHDLKGKGSEGRIFEIEYTPGLLKVIDEEGFGSGPIASAATELVRELSGEEVLAVFS